MSRHESLYESINARALSPEEVGRGFVYADHFRGLVKRSHCIVVGPRGSGKTTLMKMLQLSALDAWKRSPSKEFVHTVDYVGVFIPTDLVWMAQSTGASALETTSQHVDEFNLLGTAAFNNHVLLSALDTVDERLNLSDSSALSRFKLRLNGEGEHWLARGLGRAFELRGELRSLSHLRHELSHRMSRIGLARRRLSRKGDLELDRGLEDLVDMDVLGALSAGIEIAEDIGQGSAFRWALCFDELELCPVALRLRLLSLLRSTDDRFLFKYAMSPYGVASESFERVGEAQAGHDYELVNLTHGHRRQMEAFARSLVERILSRRFGSDVTPTSVFGRSITADRASKGRSPQPYGLGSPQQQAVERLYQSDRTFKLYMDSRDLDPSHLDVIPKKSLHREIRKVIHYIAIREAYRPPDGGGSARHMSLVPYQGVPLLYAMTEGNPRLVIGMINSMISRRDGGRVPEGAQASVYEGAIARLRSLYRTMGTPSAPGHASAPMSLIEFLDAIARYFQRATVESDFTPDPPGTFFVDGSLVDQFGSLIGTAVNVGALVHVARGDAKVLARDEDLAGERFRISYLLGAHYHLPLRLDRSVSLSTVLRGEIPSPGVEQLPGMEVR